MLVVWCMSHDVLTIFLLVLQEHIPERWLNEHHYQVAWSHPHDDCLGQPRGHGLGVRCKQYMITNAVG